MAMTSVATSLQHTVYCMLVICMRTETQRDRTGTLPIVWTNLTTACSHTSTPSFHSVTVVLSNYASFSRERMFPDQSQLFAYTLLSKHFSPRPLKALSVQYLSTKKNPPVARAAQSGNRWANSWRPDLPASFL